MAIRGWHLQTLTDCGPAFAQGYGAAGYQTTDDESQFGGEMDPPRLYGRDEAEELNGAGRLAFRTLPEEEAAHETHEATLNKPQSRSFASFRVFRGRMLRCIPWASGASELVHGCHPNKKRHADERRHYRGRATGTSPLRRCGERASASDGLLRLADQAFVFAMVAGRSRTTPSLRRPAPQGRGYRGSHEPTTPGRSA